MIIRRFDQDLLKKDRFQTVVRHTLGVKRSDLSSSNITDEQLLRGLPTLAATSLQLESVHVDDNPITYHAIKKLLKAFPRLKSVSGMPFDVLLLWAKKNSSLESLSFDGRSISMEKILELVDSLHSHFNSIDIDALAYRTCDEVVAFFPI